MQMEIRNTAHIANWISQAIRSHEDSHCQIIIHDNVRSGDMRRALPFFVANLVGNFVGMKASPYGERGASDGTGVHSPLRSFQKLLTRTGLHQGPEV